MDVIQTAVQEFLISLALAALALAAAYVSFNLSRFAQKLKAQTLAIQDEETRKVLLSALNDVERLAYTTVTAIEQTTAGALREAVADGVADRDELLALGKKAVEEVKARITPQAQKIITENVGNFDAYIKDLIEAEVYRLKNQTLEF